MRVSTSIADALGAVARRVAFAVRNHPRIAMAGASSAGATVAAAVMARRRRTQWAPDLPDVSELATVTALSVHNAAKGSVITKVREHDEPSRSLAMESVRQAIAEAASSGVDVTSAALGAVEGAIEAADLLREDRLEFAQEAAEAARFAAGVVGSVAARRVGDALASVLQAQGR
ncbi:MAG: hypothetical protein M0R73_02130 [Dehalococcoidia bacterium]|nr:hypothetical protein [Dehalococcoidia bacterium]